jgi:beta-lactamase class A
MIRILLLGTLFTFVCSAAAPGDALQQQAQEIAAHHKGGLTLYAEDLKTGRTVAIEPDRKVATASVIKLCILFDALEQIRAGKVHFEDRLTLKKEDQVPGSGVLLFFDTPAEVTLKDALRMMIIMSDNTATNLVIDHLGFANIDHRIESLGLRDTYLFNKVFAHSALPLPPERLADHKTFGLGETTAREMASVMKRIATCEAGDALCKEALTMLGDQFYRDCIPRFLDGWNAPGTGDGVAVGNKSGSLDEVRNDVAIVAAKRGPIVISAFTFDNQDHSWQADNEAELTIAKLAKAIVTAWSPEGLAPDTYNPKR